MMKNDPDYATPSRLAPPPEAGAGWELHDDDNPFMRHNGPIWYRTTSDRLECGFFPTAGAHANTYDIVHGGMIAAFADFALGHAVWFAFDRKPVVTAQLDLKFLASAKLGAWTHCTVDFARKTRSLCFPRADIFSDGTCVATAAGVWKVLGA